jgi:hypothetical protein
MSEPRLEGAETRSNRIFEWIIVASILLGGGLMLAHQALLWRRASAAQSWSIVNGIVEQSDGSCSYSRKTDVTCYIRGRYLYEVAGTRYAGNRFTFDDRDVGGPDALDSLVRRFWPGNRVAVHFDPQDPSFAVLDITSQFRPGRALLGAAAVAVGLFAAALGLKQQRRRKSRQ